MKRGLIIAGGSLDASASTAIKQLTKEMLSIGVDRGIDFFLEAGVQADYYMGDLDSIEATKIDSIPQDRLVRFSSEKNSSDLELAFNLCLEKELEEVEVYGATGSRWDHSFSNMLALDPYLQSGLKIVLRNEKNQAWALSKTECLSAQYLEGYHYLSVLPLSPEGIVISITGVKYPLDQEYLIFGKTRGVSNEGVGEDVSIQLHQGRALFIMSND